METCWKIHIFTCILSYPDFLPEMHVELLLQNRFRIHHKRVFSLTVGLGGTKEEKFLVCISLRQSGKCRVTN